jgi:iron complex outermembrane receptor protein
LGLGQARASNPGLKWEETEEFNIGLDFTYGRFDGSINAYQKTTSDLLVEVRAVQPSPSEFALSNVGEVQNTGLEFDLEAFVIEQEDLNLTVGGNVSTNMNEITDLGTRDFIDHTQVSGPGQTGVNAQRLAEGHPIGAFYGPRYVGTNDNGDELYAVEGGDPTTDNVAATKQFIGNPVPDFSYGLNVNFRYQRFDASAFFRGEQGREIFNNTALEFQYENKAGTSNILQAALDDGVNAAQTPTYSSRWIQDASFFRLSSLTIGYRLPADRLGLRRARVYASGKNLFTITPYDGYDPEVNTNVTGRGLGFRSLARPTRGVDYTSYPRPRTFTLGVQIGL